MKKFLTSTALALLIAGPVTAEQHMSTGMFVGESAHDDIYGSNLIGMNLYVAENGIGDITEVSADARTEWNDVGEIRDVLISTEGDVKAVLLDIGGFLGMGEHRIALSFDEVQIVRSDNGSDVRVYIAASQDQLEQRPEYQG